jgi:hypothetical protein
MPKDWEEQYSTGEMMKSEKHADSDGRIFTAEMLDDILGRIKSLEDKLWWTRVSISAIIFTLLIVAFAR